MIMKYIKILSINNWRYKIKQVDKVIIYRRV